MAKKSAGPSVDEVVTQALVKVATAAEPFRLAGKGDRAPLFASKSGIVKDAIDRLTNPERPLLAVVGKAKDESVRLTPAGFQAVLGQLPEEDVGGAAKALAAELPLTEQADFLNDIIQRSPLAVAELLPLYEAAVAAEKVAADARLAAAAKRRDAEEAARRAAERFLTLSQQRKQQRLDALRAELLAEGGALPTAAPPPVAAKPEVVPPPEPRPVPRADVPFRRDVAGRLVSTWLESFRLHKPEGRLFLETAMGNMGGLRQVGEEGERLPFDGKYHESDGPVTTGAPVRVVRPGWILDEDDGEYRLVPAKVSP